MRYVPLTGYLIQGARSRPIPVNESGWFVHVDRATDNDIPAVIITGPFWLVRLLRRWL